VIEIESLRVPPHELRREHDPATFHFECTEELVPLTEFVGQDRALRALQFGLELDRDGYNIFVTGLTGTGKTTAILEYIKRAVEAKRGSGELKPPSDWVYVYNFDDPDRPNALALPPGGGRRLKEHLEQLLRAVRGNLRRALSSDEYQKQRNAIIERGQEEAEAAIREAQQAAEREGFFLRVQPTGVLLAPIKDGRPLSPEEFTQLSAEERSRIEEKERPLAQTINETMQRLRAIEQQVAAAVRQLDRLVAQTVLKGAFDGVKAEYVESPRVLAFLDRLMEHTLENTEILQQDEGGQSAAALGPPVAAPYIDPFIVFHCNCFVDNTGAQDPPVIVEANPTWTNLFGRIERRAYLGTYLSDHTMLKAGSVHKANGGYLILNLADTITKPGSWDGLKRLIRTKEVRLEDPMEQYGYVTPQTLRPEPIPARIKLVITGDPMSYFLLSIYEEEFWEMFKVKAEFDYQIPRDQENTLAYAGFICMICQRENLCHFDRSAVARVIEYGSRAVDDQDKLSARFGRLRDLLVESDYWARRAGAHLVSAEHVERAIEESVLRLNLVEERIRDMIARGTIMVDVAGSVVGQVNGLSVLDFGEYRFGRPSRITAQTSLGQRGVASIDRESQLSGKIHDKGVLTLTGYLAWKYAQDKPLSFSASVSFEQGYEPVEGDSASLAELCAILSSLSQLPIRQDLAVTGSINQKGEVQPIGGVNQKIEGFHDVCREIGFTGQQGVIIPTRNKKNLMLRRDVVESVAAGRFHVFAVETVDQAIEILTGVEAGERREDGSYPQGSVNQRVDERIREMSEALRRYARRPTDGGPPTGTQPQTADPEDADTDAGPSDPPREEKN
jgi:lon-related putative ATP-dependent protease